MCKIGDMFGGKVYHLWEYPWHKGNLDESGIEDAFAVLILSSIND